MSDFVAALEEVERAQLIADLKAARAELVVRGRCTDWFIEDDGRVCALGALGVATSKHFASLSRDHQSVTALCDRRPRRATAALEKHLPDWARGWVHDFNDDERTTDQDVLDLFDKTLADLGGLA